MFGWRDEKTSTIRGEERPCREGNDHVNEGTSSAEVGKVRQVREGMMERDGVEATHGRKERPVCRTARSEHAQRKEPPFQGSDDHSREGETSSRKGLVVQGSDKASQGEAE